MGGCISSHASTKDTRKLVLKILAEVNTLPADESEEPQCWKRLFHSLVPVTLTYTQDGDVYMYKVSASGVDGSTFSAAIRVPGTELHKTSSCFIQWQEEGGGEGGGGEGAVWGLNFMSEEDAIKFLKGCTPPTLTPESKKQRYSLPITPHHVTPPPPPDYSENRLSDSFESIESETHSNHEYDSHSPIPDSTSPQYGYESQDAHVVPMKTASFDAPMQPYTHTSTLSDVHVAEERLQSGYGVGEEAVHAYPSQTAGEDYGEGNRDYEQTSGRDRNMLQGVQMSGMEWEMNDLEPGVEQNELFDVEGDQEREWGVQGRGVGADASTPELFEPASPLHLMPTGILQDIAEETEGDTEFEHSWNVGEMGLMDAVRKGLRSSKAELERLEYVETSFLDNMTENTRSLVIDELGGDKTPPQSAKPSTPPRLPVSPPPGPVLSPRLSMLLAEAAAMGSHIPANPDLSAATGGVGDRYNLMYRLSVASISDEPPPPLPSSLPPGKLISPRHSLMGPEHGVRSDSIAGGIGTGLDIALLAQKVSRVKEARQNTDSQYPGPEGLVQNEDRALTERTGQQPEAECNGDNEEPLLITTIDEVDDSLEELCDETLPPPVTPNHLTGGSKLTITPSFLQSLEPPREFSDSGFPDTDHENVQTTPEPGATADQPTLDLSAAADREASDEMTTECSGSVGRHPPSLDAHDGGPEDSSKSSSSSSPAEGEREERGREKTGEGASTASPATRKTGWLELKAMLVRKNRKVAMKSKRRWRRFWATLKGSSLLFSACGEEASSTTDDMPVDIKLDLALSLSHAVHDHVKRDFIFCLSTANGNTYYLQTTSVSEMEDWIAAIHCAAAVAMTKHTSKEKAVQIIKSKMEALNTATEKETQLRNLTELNLTTVTDYHARSMASKQLVTCTENIERYSVETYRLRCYMASLQGTELPNPQTLLASISKPTKLALGKVGVFSVASLHAIVSARSIPSTTSIYGSFRFGRNSKPTSSTSTKGKGPKSKTPPRGPEKFSSKSSLRSLEISGPYPMLPASALHSLAQSYSEREETTDTESPFSPDSHQSFSAVPVLNVVTPGNKMVSVALHDDMKIEDVLHASCQKRQLEPRDHFVRLRLERKDGEFECEIPDQKEQLQDQEYTHVELCQKWTHTVILSQPDLEHSANTFDLTLEPYWDSGGNRLETVVVGRVVEGGAADRCGVWEGDEVLRVNGRGVRDAGWVGTRSALDAASVSLTLKTCHIEMPVSEVSNQIMESLICPAPPSSHMELSPEMISQLTVPTPSREDMLESSKRYSGTFSREQIDTLLRDSHELSKLLRTWEVQRAKEEPSPVWTLEDRLRKSAQDLVDTERDYVRLLHLLVERYLEPLRAETFISQADQEVLEGNIIEILEFQTKFLQGLEEAMMLEMKPSQVPPGDSILKHVMFGVAGTFLCHMESFRMYSTFCASHYKINQLLRNNKCSVELSEFLDIRNPRHDHSLTLTALLAKPIVRVSRYPLFLNAMIDNTPQDSEERAQLTDVLEGMTRVANHINEMQRVSDTYCSLFDAILSENAATVQRGVSLSVPQLWYHSEVMWLNPSEEHRAGKTSWKKGQGPQTICFVFAAAVVMVCLDKKMRRRTSKPLILDVEVAAEDTKFRILLPSLHCSVHDLPDSDGVTNMWQLRYKSNKLSVSGNSSPSLSLSSSSSSSSCSYLLRSQSMEQKSAMVHLIRQSISEQCQLHGVGTGSPLPPSSPHHSPSHTRLTHSPRHSPSQGHITRTHHPSSHSHNSHSSPHHSPSHPRSFSHPLLPRYTSSPLPSPLSQSHISTVAQNNDIH